jgi:hypothetical protein
MNSPLTNLWPYTSVEDYIKDLDDMEDQELKSFLKDHLDEMDDYIMAVHKELDYMTRQREQLRERIARIQ